MYVGIRTVKISYQSCMYARAIYEIGVVVSYECGVVDSRQIHLRCVGTCVPSDSESCGVIRLSKLCAKAAHQTKI